jgi:hypothetical protein
VAWILPPKALAAGRGGTPHVAKRICAHNPEPLQLRVRDANEVKCSCQCHVRHGIAHSSATNNIATDPATCTLRGAYHSLSTNDISPNNATLICRCVYSIHLEDNVRQVVCNNSSPVGALPLHMGQKLCAHRS